MKINNIIIILYILISFVIQKSIRNGVYNIINEQQYLSYYKKELFLSFKFNINTFFRIIKVLGYFNYSLYRI